MAGKKQKQLDNPFFSKDTKGQNTSVIVLKKRKI